MKLTQADISFSACIRERAYWTCECCLIESVQGRMTKKDQSMQCSHFIGRKHKATRYLGENCLCLCASCHANIENDPGEHSRLLRRVKGHRMELYLSKLKQEIVKPPGGWKQHEKLAAAYYREQFKRMDQLRLDGNIGRIDFDSYR